jgi:Xaa-Pro aminopeptidase
MQKRCIAAARPGKSLKEINELYKKMMRSRGYRVRHSIGHGVGSRVHERVKGPLKPGEVITIEPGVYERKGGCRVEDMVLITRSKPEVLTKNIRFSRP